MAIVVNCTICLLFLAFKRIQMLNTECLIEIKSYSGDVHVSQWGGYLIVNGEQIRCAFSNCDSGVPWFGTGIHMVWLDVTPRGCDVIEQLTVNTHTSCCGYDASEELSDFLDTIPHGGIIAGSLYSFNLYLYTISKDFNEIKYIIVNF